MLHSTFLLTPFIRKVGGEVFIITLVGLAFIKESLGGCKWALNIIPKAPRLCIWPQTYQWVPNI
jgi:hypothetical protein